MSIKLKSIISAQVPDFVREDYPTFVAFLEAYYQYLDQYEKRDLIDIRDIDRTLDSFITYFKNELDIFGENYKNIEKRFYLRKSKEIFASKGTEAAYRFLFKILFDKPAEIYYPWDQVLKASDGKWNQDVSMFVRVTSGDPSALTGNKIEIVGDNKAIGVFVTKTRQYINPNDLATTNIYEIFIDKNYFGTINPGYKINFNGFSGTVLPTTNSYEIIRPGAAFKVGQIFDATTISNGTVITQKLKVTRVDANGGILNLTTLKFGCDYELDFYVSKSNVPAATGSNIIVDKDGNRQLDSADDSKIESYTDYGVLVNPIYADINYSDNTYAGLLLHQYYNQTESGNTETTNYAIIKFVIGGTAKYQGHYITNDGFLDDEVYLQDSEFYQKYSYVIKVDEKLQDYKSLVKAYLHPAGAALFGEYQIQNTYKAEVMGSLFLGEYESLSSKTEINRSIGDMFVYASDAGGRIRIDPYDEDYVMPEEYYNPPITYRFFGDGRNNLKTTITVSDETPSTTLS